jgi:hypothetical protein
MGGEFAGGQFDVTKLEAIEIEKVAGVETPSNIIDAGETFYLKATFGGSGPGWANVVGKEYVAKFYAEGMGWGISNQNLGTDTGTVTSATQQFAQSPNKVINTDGLYRCGVTVSFRDPVTLVPFYGCLGYNEDCVIQIGGAEEIG